RPAPASRAASPLGRPRPAPGASGWGCSSGENLTQYRNALTAWGQCGQPGCCAAAPAGGRADTPGSPGVGERGAPAPEGTGGAARRRRGWTGGVSLQGEGGGGTGRVVDRRPALERSRGFRVAAPAGLTGRRGSQRGQELTPLVGRRRGKRHGCLRGSVSLRAQRPPTGTVRRRRRGVPLRGAGRRRRG